VPCRCVRHTTCSTEDNAQSSISRVVDYSGAWNIIGKKGLHTAFKQIRVHGITEFMPRFYTKGDSFPPGALISYSSDIFPVSHGGRNVYHLKDDVERFADEALKTQSSGRDLLDLVNRYESLRDVRSSVSTSYCAHIPC